MPLGLFPGALSRPLCLSPHFSLQRGPRCPTLALPNVREEKTPPTPTIGRLPPSSPRILPSHLTFSGLLVGQVGLQLRELRFFRGLVELELLV